MLKCLFCSNTQQMRNIETINDSWHFYKESLENPVSNAVAASWEKATITHLGMPKIF